MIEIKENIDVSVSLAPDIRTASANGTSVDLQNAQSALVTFHSETAITDGTHTPSVEESDDDATFTAVAAADLSGSLTAFSSSAEGVQRQGYLGNKRYIRGVLTVTGGPGTGGRIGCLIFRGNPRKAPLS